MSMILSYDCLAIDLTHKARFLTAVCLVKADKMAAEFLLEYVRKEEDRCLNLYAGKTPGRGQLIKVSEESGHIAPVRCKRHDAQNAQCRVQHNPKPACGDRRFARLCVFG